LRAAGALERGHVKAVGKDTTPTIFGSFVSRLAVSYSDDAPQTAPTRLFLKVNARELQFRIPGIGRRETDFYSAVADSMGTLPVVHCYSAVFADGRAQVLLDDLSETHISFPPSQFPPVGAYCEMIVDALADLHAYWWDNPKLGRKIGELPTEASLKEEVDGNAELLPKFVDFMQDRLSPARVRVHERVAGSLHPLLARRFSMAKALTLIFEDVHAGNFLYPRDPQRDRLYIIDWEQWRVNTGPHDLAYMMAMFWFPERRARTEMPLLQRYYRRFQERGVQDYTWDDCWYDYRLSVLRLLFHPAWQWEHGGPPDIWFNHLERLHLAFEDLHCEELLLSEQGLALAS
jgi:hypothetical protein